MITPALLLSCLKIAGCRILDVTCGTVRTILTVKEKSIAAALVGFCEVFLWYIIVQSAMSADGPVIIIAAAYAGGYAMGTFVGSRVARAVISGNVTVQVVTSRRDDALLSSIRDAGYAITVLNANESEFAESKYLIIATVDKKQLKAFEDLVKAGDEKAFIMVSDTKSSVGGYFGK
ncbi:MAG: DUF5698 domain-containing protein [Clostridia bacterium]|jgi:uncharacterized protein YebE (UPF0316 family)|nr:DUF5698 domain-containing protein [Clostridia bacterium]